MTPKPTVAIVGAGNLGTALSISLFEAGYRIAHIVSRANRLSLARARRLAAKLHARLTTTERPSLEADVVWICVPDNQIRAVATLLSRAGEWKNKIVFHSSGALTSDELAALRRKRAKVASVHPMMTFVRGVRPGLDGVPFAIEGDPAAERVARRIVRDLRGDPFLIARRNKAVYHAWGAFASPLLIATLVTAEQVAHRAGIPGRAGRIKMLPIIDQTIRNYRQRGADDAFSGPIIRGDAETVRKHLQVLASMPFAKDVYVALARAALKYLPSRGRSALKKILG